MNVHYTDISPICIYFLWNDENHMKRVIELHFTNISSILVFLTMIIVTIYYYIFADDLSSALKKNLTKTSEFIVYHR